MTSINPNSVLVVGAAGYIGLAVAVAFRKEGYFVYGLIRNKHKTVLLHANEIVPVIGDAEKLDTYREYVTKAAIIIDCSGSYTKETENEVVPLTILRGVEEASKQHDKLLPRKIFIYTSGTMVYAHDPAVRDEHWPIAGSSSVYATWSRMIEEPTVTSNLFHGVVIRPGWVFGGSGGFVAANGYFSAHNDALVFNGEHKDRKFSWVHIDDLAAAYVAAAQNIERAKGRVFNIVNGYDNPVQADLWLQGTRLAGNQGEIRWEKAQGWVHETNDANVVLKPTLALELLGWRPKIFGLMENLSFYYETYKALQGPK